MEDHDSKAKSELKERILERISSRAAVLFETFKWTWGVGRGRFIPTTRDIKEVIGTFLRDIEEEGDLRATGRLMILRSELGYEIYVEIGCLPADFDSLGVNELQAILDDLEREDKHA